MTVIIAAIPRSGSSLAASIFAAHGLWVGEHRIKDQVKTPTPYDSFENVQIDQWFRNRREPLQALVDSILPKGKLLVYKCSPAKAKDAHQQLSGSTVVRCLRNFESIVKSSPDGQREHRATQLVTLASINGSIIDIDAVMARNFSSLKAAMAECGITFNHDLAESCIDDSLWHHQ